MSALPFLDLLHCTHMPDGGAQHQKRMLARLPASGSAFTSIAAQQWTSRIGRFVPCVDGSELAKLSSRLQHWSVQPCVRPLDAVHMTATPVQFRAWPPILSSYTTPMKPH